jgi:hypothetical protein
VDGLFGDAETAGDVLPGPAKFSCPLDLEEFQPFGEPAKGGNRTQADVGVLTCGAFCDLDRIELPAPARCQSDKGVWCRRLSAMTCRMLKSGDGER